MKEKSKGAKKMIADNLKNYELYCPIHKNFKSAFEFLKKATREDLPVGRYELDGDNLFALVQEYDSKAVDMAKNEAHQRYIDIQHILSGTESLAFFDLRKGVAKTEYNDVKDVQFYEDCTQASHCILEAGEYAIFFPQDIHKPGMCINGVSTPVKKVVVKIKI